MASTTSKKPTPKKDDKPEKAAKVERQLPDDQKLAVVDIPANEPYPTKED